MRFHRGALKALRHGAANMDVLVSLGTNAAYLYSILAMMTAAALHNEVLLYTLHENSIQELC